MEASEQLLVHLKKDGDPLGFSVGHDTSKRVQVSAVHDSLSPLRIGDTLLSVNGTNVTDQPISTVIQSLQSIPAGDLTLKVERRRESARENDALATHVCAPGDLPAKAALKPRKRARPSQRMVDDNGQPVNVKALLADLMQERRDKAALDEKNALLRKRLQSMLIETDQVRVHANAQVEKAHQELTKTQHQLATARAQLRLQERAPDVQHTDSILHELSVCRTQLENLTREQEEQTKVLTARYKAECRLATADAKRVLAKVVEIVQTKLRQIGRKQRNGTTTSTLEIACEGVRRLTFMELFKLPHDFASYSSAAFYSLEPVSQILGNQKHVLDVFGTSLRHEERAGVFYVATAPMVASFDPTTETLKIQCQWDEEHALQQLAQSFRTS
ncbi:hypothetical protein PsorP6_009413 [Peronosclerospora sorghi]|uniref:Uncharacterized protein n=1 Tax=Peronosclerospora sorghi TaxID=230839 RepID=A0ACC0W1F4_9STRA|nr:hypothetical protein PsorP6_009413 [Peronosclerospora sorghi]